MNEADRLGEWAALATAGCWVVSALAFERAGRRIGALSVNFIRLVVACVLIAAMRLVLVGQALPAGIAETSWAWLIVSSLIGLVVGDFCLFRAYVLVGPRVSSLIMATAPACTAILAYALLDERLSATDLIGMGLTAAGVGWAISERRTQSGASGGELTRGLLLAFGGALGQAGGLICSKLGMRDGTDALLATQVRVITGVVAFGAICTLVGWWPAILRSIRDSAAMRPALLGSVFGPVLGVTFSLAAVSMTHAGVAASIMATTPILLIPIAMVMGEKVGRGGVLGTLLAVAGVGVLFTW